MSDLGEHLSYVVLEFVKLGKALRYDPVVTCEHPTCGRSFEMNAHRARFGITYRNKQRVAILHLPNEYAMDLKVLPSPKVVANNIMHDLTYSDRAFVHTQSMQVVELTTLNAVTPMLYQELQVAGVDVNDIGAGRVHIYTPFR